MEDPLNNTAECTLPPAHYPVSTGKGQATPGHLNEGHIFIQASIKLLHCTLHTAH